MAEQAYYSVHPKFHAAVDCIIFGFEEGELSLLLLQRNFEPAKGEWSLAGGFVWRTARTSTTPPAGSWPN